METISEFFKEEQDFLYRKGEAKGEAKGLAMGEELKNKQFVEKLISKMNFNDLQIAELVDVPLAFVKKIRKQLKG